MNGYLEASYPSSHTLMTICLCGSAIMINEKLFKNNFSKFINIISAIVILVTIIGRLISGVHWFTDIAGGIIISISLLMTLHSIIEKIRKNN